MQLSTCDFMCVCTLVSSKSIYLVFSLLIVFYYWIMYPHANSKKKKNKRPGDLVINEHPPEE